jgi:hypothetical protein
MTTTKWPVSKIKTVGLITIIPWEAVTTGWSFFVADNELQYVNSYDCVQKDEQHVIFY